MKISQPAVAHADLTGVTADQHHAQSHAARHETGGADLLGDLTLATILKVNANIQFPAAQVADAGANVFDDYEEGTWTPVLNFGGASVGITYGVQTGRYTKEGRTVAMGSNITLTSKGTSVGAAQITGLAFTGFAAIQPVVLYLNVVTFANAFQGIIAASSAVCDLAEITELGVGNPLNDTDFAATSQVNITTVYVV